MSERVWLPVDLVRLAVAEAKKQGVSTVAAGPGGFAEAYRLAGGDLEDLETRRHRGTGQDWRKRRNDFVARHMAQVEARDESLWKDGAPTRRHLALAVWAYSPSPKRLRTWLESSKSSK